MLRGLSPSCPKAVATSLHAGDRLGRSEVPRRNCTRATSMSLTSCLTTKVRVQDRRRGKVAWVGSADPHYRREGST